MADELIGLEVPAQSTFGDRDLLLPHLDHWRQLVNQVALHKGFYVSVFRGDYAGSIAKYIPQRSLSADDVVIKRGHGSTYWYLTGVSAYSKGKLKYKGQKYTPRVDLYECRILLDYVGEEVYCKKDYQSISDSLLSEDVLDTQGNALKVGDKVLYLNLRYGCGGKLCTGTILKFKAKPKSGSVSVIIQQEGSEQESQCNYPSMQIYKLLALP